MAIETSKLISNLIGAGSDANANLFNVTITESSTVAGNPIAEDVLNNLTYRINNFVIPVHDVATVDLEWQGTRFKRPAPATSLDRTFTIPLRVDQHYNVYQSLKKAIPLPAYQLAFQKSLNVQRKFTVTVTSYNSSQVTVAGAQDAKGNPTSTTNNSLTEQISWIFNDCILTSMSSFTLDHNNTDAISVNLTFIYGSLNLKK